MNAFAALPPFNPKGFLHVITETPKGSRNKYSYDPALGLFRLKKVLPVGAVFPFDFGFIPGTIGEDGDPLDVLILMEEPCVQGCLVEARLIGVIEASQTKEGNTVRNDRFIATARKTKGVCRPATIKGLNADMLSQIQHFFISYNEIEGKRFKILRVSGPAAAKQLVDKAATRTPDTVTLGAGNLAARNRERPNQRGLLEGTSRRKRHP